MTTWCWRRLISPAAQQLWLARLESTGTTSWVVTERAERRRAVLEAYPGTKPACAALAQKWGGQVRASNPRDWFAKVSPPTRIGRRLEILHEEKQLGREVDSSRARLHIPHGLAFGSGEHATTFMLLRALAKRADLAGKSVLDLGTGSGVLALAARLFGAKRIVATDFDPDAVRTARQNEKRNFARSHMKWQCADVRKLSPATRYDLVLANLFSGILVEAAPKISRSLAADGELWLSGVLVSQQNEVAKAYRREKLKLIDTRRRGKWVMLRWRRPPTASPAAQKTPRKRSSQSRPQPASTG